MKQIIVGGIPAPVGGVTSYLRRLLHRDNGQIDLLLDIYGLNDTYFPHLTNVENGIQLNDLKKWQSVLTEEKIAKINAITRMGRSLYGYCD